MKTQYTGGEKIFAEYVSDKGLVFKVHKEHIQVISRNTNGSNNFKWTVNIGKCDSKPWLWERDKR